MEKIKEQKEFKGYKDVCKFCGKEIYGFSEKQVNKRMEIHQGSNACKEKRDDLQTKNTL